MQRKCNLSLYPRNSHIKHCWLCKARLRDNNSLSVFCSSECLEKSRPESTHSKRITTSKTRKAEIPIDEWQSARQVEQFEDDSLWVRQSDVWQKALLKGVTSRRFHRRDRDRKPLILTGHGVQLKLNRGALIVRNGFVYHPQRRQEWKLFPGDRNMPSRIVLLDTSGYITLDVIQWLSTQGVPLILLNWKGEVAAICGGDGTQSDPQLRQLQLMARGHPALNIGTHLIKEKLKNCVETILSLPAYDHASAIREINAIAVALDRSCNINELRMFEARAAGIYFGMWYELELNWKGSNRGHVPPAWTRIGPRRSDITARNRYATHPINAMLNYAYMMLETQVHSATIEHGLDPTVGFIHALRSGRRALIYDLMEPLRPLVDRLVLRFALSQRFTAKDFLLSPTGICRLHPKLVERISSMTVDSDRINGVAQSLVDQLDVFAHGKDTLPPALIAR